MCLMHLMLWTYSELPNKKEISRPDNENKL